MTTVTLSTAASCIKACIAQDVPAFLWGPPGVGKSEVIDQVGVDLDLPVIDFRASLRDPVDMRGLPLIDQETGTTRWLPPSELPSVAKHGERGILKLDELNTASQAMQAACFGLVLERRLGEYELPNGWIPIAAGNRMKDRAAAQRMPSALKNRFAHFEVEADLNTWCNWANTKQLSPIVIAFLRFRSELLHVMPENDDNAFPTPRAWSKVCRFVEQPKEIRLQLVSSLVGEGPAAELEGFIRVYESIPSIDKIIADPKKAKMPKESEPATLYAVSSALARRADRKNFEAILTYAKRFPMRELEIVTAVDAVKRDVSLCQTQAFCDWTVANQDVTL